MANDYLSRVRDGQVRPYVGEGADGCRRSAQVVRDEIDTLASDDPVRGRLEAIAAAWDELARRPS